METIEKRRISHVEIHRLLCDDCGIEMQQSGLELPTNPVQYPFLCPKCGKAVNVDKIFPYTSLIFGDVVED